MKPTRHSHERVFGKYTTPPATVAFMVDLVMPHIGPDSVILDPAVGDGVFPQELVGRGVAADKILAFDIQQEAVDRASSLGCRARVQDSLRPFSERPDVVIGNPPYGDNEHAYLKENRDWLRRDLHPIQPTNLATLFLARAVLQVKLGGRICMIVPDNFLTNIWYQPLRQLILETCKIKTIVLAPPDLFHSEQADIRTAIILLERCGEHSPPQERRQNVMLLVDRLTAESEYHKPPRAQMLEQEVFIRLQRNNFVIGVPPSILRKVEEAPFKLGDLCEGGTGISTGNDRRFLKPRKEVAENPAWVPYYKGEGYKPYYYESKSFIEKDWEQYYKQVPSYLVRNSRYFLRAGITTSSVGIRFSASYMPPGCIFGMNSNFIFATDSDLYFCLAYLNSAWVQYVLRLVLNRTNNVSAGTTKLIPVWKSDPDVMNRLGELAREAVARLQARPDASVSDLQSKIDELTFELVGLEERDRETVRSQAAQIRRLM